MSDKLRWGILATGRIASTFAKGLAHSESGVLSAVASRTQAAADAFAKAHSAPTAYEGYQKLLADDGIDAVYIATPHTFHAEWAIRAARAAKHILCEKPIGINHAQATAIVEAARENDVFLMEAFMYRCHPQTAKLVELIQSGAIGQVRFIEASFGFSVGDVSAGRLFDPALGGGGILDVGCYPVSMARLVAGVAVGKDFADPVQLAGAGRMGAAGVDDWAACTMKFESGIIAQAATGVRVSMENVVRIHGSAGRITIPKPWITSREGGASSIILQQEGHEPEEIIIETDRWLYAIEADTVAANIANREAPSPAMSLDDTLGNMKALDAWRASLGLVYPSEKPEGLTLTVSGGKLAVRRDSRMKYAEIPGVGKKVSTVLLGTMSPSTHAEAAVIYDDFFERGGNAFDTAHIYGGGHPERLFGQWVKTRGIREEVVILGKGAHTPWCNPHDLTRQLFESLDRLETDYVDIYMLHRDNPEVPVGEFVDVLNEHKRAGRIRAFGGSNWGIERIEEANRYAAAKGLEGMCAVSNNFSLAEMVNPVWGGCISASDPDFRAWLEKTGMPLFAWSSQARGFFTGRSAPDDFSDPELADSWYSDANFERKRRAVELAEKLGVLPINIALAYVLCQPFPAFAIIGPMNVHETRTSLFALDVKLDSKQLAWLNLEA